jgi:hypothetical protein
VAPRARPLGSLLARGPVVLLLGLNLGSLPVYVVALGRDFGAGGAALGACVLVVAALPLLLSRVAADVRWPGERGATGRGASPSCGASGRGASSEARS